MGGSGRASGAWGVAARGCGAGTRGGDGVGAAVGRVAVVRRPDDRAAGHSPPGHRYPARDFLAFHTARLDGVGAPTTPPSGTEAVEAAWLSPDEVAARCSGAAWLPLHAELVAHVGVPSAGESPSQPPQV
ncbi:hypothetical protein ACU686_35220 [Yinghuangia aomiensis]